MQNEKTKKTKSARSAFIIGLLITIFGGIIIFATVLQNQNSTSEVQSKTHSIAELSFAITEAEKQRGLCCRSNLPGNAGMLFVYDKPGNYRFWMKNTRIPLDMYWLDSQKKIVHIEHSVQPSSYPETFGTEIPAQYILETNAGYAKKHSIKVGDIISF